MTLTATLVLFLITTDPDFVALAGDESNNDIGITADRDTFNKTCENDVVLELLLFF